MTAIKWIIAGYVIAHVAFIFVRDWITKCISREVKALRKDFETHKVEQKEKNENLEQAIRNIPAPWLRKVK